MYVFIWFSSTTRRKTLHAEDCMHHIHCSIGSECVYDKTVLQHSIYHSLWTETNIKPKSHLFAQSIFPLTHRRPHGDTLIWEIECSGLGISLLSQLEVWWDPLSRAVLALWDWTVMAANIPEKMKRDWRVQRRRPARLWNKVSRLRRSQVFTLQVKMQSSQLSEFIDQDRQCVLKELTFLPRWTWDYNRQFWLNQTFWNNRSLFGLELGREGGSGYKTSTHSSLLYNSRSCEMSHS